MSPEYYRIREGCRSCGAGNLREIYRVGPIPVAGIYYGADAEPKNIQAPMTLSHCEACGLVQLLETIHADQYMDYSFVGNSTPSYEKYLESVTDLLVSEWSVRRKQVLEIGASNGILIKMLAEKGGNDALGIEPSQKLCQDAVAHGTQVRQGYFNSQYVGSNDLGKFDCVIIRHVLEHIDDLNDLVSALNAVLAEDGMVVVEVPDVGKVFSRRLFSNIFHEHLNYFSRFSLDGLFARHRLKAVRASEVDIHGGSLFCIYKRGGGEAVSTDAPDHEGMKRFSEMAGHYYESISRRVGELTGSGGVVHGYGASHRTFVLMGNAGLSGAEIPCIHDNNRFLHNRRLNGFHSLVLPADALMDNTPDAVAIFATSYENEITDYLVHQLGYEGQILSLRYEVICGMS